MIWLIGGTRESGEIAQILSTLDIAYLVTVTTVEACSLYPETLIKIGALSSSEILDLGMQHQITGIVDASHPYAQIISQQAIEYALNQSVPYLRYERPNLDFPASDRLEIENLETLLTGDYLLRERVLLTLGYKALPKFKIWQEKTSLFTRVLPSLVSLQIALESGFTCDRIIAMRPPISLELERALWQQWNITTVVTKANGQVGGEATKQQLAKELGIKLIVLARPHLIYPEQTANLEEIILFSQRFS